MRFLAASWLVVGLAYVGARSWISILVFGKLEYTLGVVAALTVVPLMQALALTWAMGGFADRPSLPSPRSRLGRLPVGVLWSVELAVLVVVCADGAGWLDLPFSALRLVELAIGMFLLASAGLLIVAARRFRGPVGALRVYLLAGASTVLGALGIVSAAGIQWSVAQRFAPLAAVASITAGLALAPFLLWAARPVGSPSWRPLEAASVLVIAAASATPVCLYLRPYLGPLWLVPALVLFSLAAACVVTSAVQAVDAREALAMAAQPPSSTISTRTGLAVYMVLVVVYATVWIGGSMVGGAGWRLSQRTWFEVVLVSAAQAVAVLLWFAVRWAADHSRPAVFLPPRRWILLPLAAESVVVLVFWWTWPAGDGPLWSWLVLWTGLKTVLLGVVLVATTVRRDGRSAIWSTAGLAVVGVAVLGLATWHTVAWTCLIVVVIPARQPGWRFGRLLVIGIMMPVFLTVVPSLVLGIRPLDMAIAGVITLGVMTTSLLFGWLPPRLQGADGRRHGA